MSLGFASPIQKSTCTLWQPFEPVLGIALLHTAYFNFLPPPFLCYRSSVTYSSHSYTHSVVAATAETKKFAESNNYGVYAPVETFEAVAGAKYNHLYLSPM